MYASVRCTMFITNKKRWGVTMKTNQDAFIKLMREVKKLADESGTETQELINKMAEEIRLDRFRDILSQVKKHAQ